MAKEVNNENEAVVTAVSKVEKFLQGNKKTIWGIIIALIVLAAVGYVCYKFVYIPKKIEALAQMYKAEAAFRDGNYDLAMKGDGNVMGFEDIISEYGAKAGKSVYMYAAICSLNAEDPDAALSYISKYSTKDKIMAGRAESLKGDAYSAKENPLKAASCYMEAAKATGRTFRSTYLLKAGQAYEAAGQAEKALDAYKIIKDQYPSSIEAYEIDKHISRIEVK